MRKVACGGEGEEEDVEACSAVDSAVTLGVTLGVTLAAEPPIPAIIVGDMPVTRMMSVSNACDRGSFPSVTTGISQTSGGRASSNATPPPKWEEDVEKEEEEVEEEGIDDDIVVVGFGRRCTSPVTIV